MNLQTLLSDSTKVLIMIDGYCLLCHGFARFVLGQDRAGAIWFAALQDDDISGVLAQEKVYIPDVDSVVAISGRKVYTKSQAILKALSFLPRYRQWTSIGYIVPTFLADKIYDYVARHRIGRFGQKDDCDLQGVKELQERVVNTSK